MQQHHAQDDDGVEAAVKIPMLHIARRRPPTGWRRTVSSAGLIGTRFTMGESFYRDRLEAHGIAACLAGSRTWPQHIDRIIFEELAKGQVSRKLAAPAEDLHHRTWRRRGSRR